MTKEYKDSGIEWANKIPSDWKVIKGKHLLQLMNRPVRETDDVVTCFRDGEVVLRSERRTEGFTMSDKEIGYQGINKGDIVIHGMDGFAGSMGISKSTGKGSPVLIVCNPKGKDDSRYIIYYLRALAMNNVFLALATGIRERSCDLRWNKISELPFIRPKLEKQKHIADFIDKKSSEIDTLVTLQEQMIAQLIDYKQSVVTEAVTKGLNPDAEFVPSGIDWIGDVPKGWKPMRMKYIGEFQNGLTYSPHDVCGAEGILVLRSSNIQKAKITFDDNVYVKSAPASLMVKEGDIIICSRNGSASLIGKCALIEEGVIASYGAFMVRFRSRIGNKYAFYLISTVIPQYKQLFTTTTINQLTKGMLSSMIGVLPPEDEQVSIASYLDSKCSEIDTLIALKRQKIETLKEYKKSIIYEAVTGKTIIE